MAPWLGVMAKPQIINNHVLSWTIDAVPDTASAAAAKFFYMLLEFFCKITIFIVVLSAKSCNTNNRVNGFLVVVKLRAEFEGKTAAVTNSSAC